MLFFIFKKCMKLFKRVSFLFMIDLPRFTHYDFIDFNSIEFNFIDSNSINANSINANSIDANSIGSNSINANFIDSNSTNANSIDSNSTNSNISQFDINIFTLKSKRILQKTSIILPKTSKLTIYQ